MTKDDVIRMWKESGDLEIIGMPYAKIEAFAKLVAEHEREACAKVCEEYETANDIADTWLNIVSEVIRARGQA